ncbi:MAG: hypothetical protein ABFC75_05515 [Rectinema sp.]
MRVKEFVGWYFRSALGIVSAALGVACTVALAGAGVSFGLALPAGIALLAISAGVSFATGAGPRSALAERDAATAREGRGKLADMEALRDRLARLRIADAEVSDAVRLAVLAAGECIDACKLESTYDPLAAEALAEALDIVDIYLRESDDASTEKRYSLEDKDHFADARERAVSGVRERSVLMRERRLQIDGGLSAENRMSIREELK